PAAHALRRLRRVAALRHDEVELVRLHDLLVGAAEVELALHLSLVQRLEVEAIFDLAAGLRSPERDRFLVDELDDVRVGEVLLPLVPGAGVRHQSDAEPRSLRLDEENSLGRDCRSDLFHGEPPLLTPAAATE